jgi:transposase
VAEILKSSHNTITKWVRRFNEGGFGSLRDESRSGRPKKLDYKDLETALEQSPDHFGYPHEVWFPKLVYQYILDYQEVEIAFEYVYEVIDKLGYSLVVPRTKSYKSDPEKVKLFKKTLRK